jgi:phage-related protein
MVARRALEWVGSSLDDLRRFPAEVRRVFGQAIDDAEHGGEHPNAKALKGFGGRSVLEVVENFDGDSSRAVYTVRFSGVVYACMPSRRSRNEASPPRNMNLMSSKPALNELRIIVRIMQRKPPNG